MILDVLSNKGSEPRLRRTRGTANPPNNLVVNEKSIARPNRAGGGGPQASIAGPREPMRLPAGLKSPLLVLPVCLLPGPYKFTVT